MPGENTEFLSGRVSESLKAQVDRFCEEHGISLQDFLQHAAAHALGTLQTIEKSPPAVVVEYGQKLAAIRERGMRQEFDAVKRVIDWAHEYIKRREAETSRRSPPPASE